MLSWLPGFAPQAYPTTISSLTSPRSSPRSISPKATAACALGLLHNPQTPGPGCCAFQGTCIPDKDCLILVPFRLPEISCCTLSFECFSSDSDSCPDAGIRPLLQFPHPPRASPVPLTPLFFHLALWSYRVLCGWFYIFFSAGQVLLSALSWCSACISMSEFVFLMYL